MPAYLRESKPLERCYVTELTAAGEFGDSTNLDRPALLRHHQSLVFALHEADARLFDAPLQYFAGADLIVTGFGIAARIDSLGATGIADAAKTWRDLAATIEVVSNTETTAPSWPIALGSFGFAASAHGCLIIPEWCLVTLANGRSYGLSWNQPWDLHPASTPSPAPLAIPDLVDLAPGALTGSEWMEAVAAVTQRLRRGEARKVVLARDVIARFAAPLQPRAVLAALAERYPECWLFLIDGLVGASPELIARVRPGAAADLTCRILAGSCARGQEATLAASAKDHEEHVLACESVLTRLADITSQISVTKGEYVLRLPNISHLATDVGATLNPGVSSLEVAAALHPTAAVCGLPRAQAARIIAEHEQLGRGRYAAPIGWIDAAGAGEWALALRLGQLDAEDPRRIRLFAGAGIMPDSEPRAELRETELKLDAMLRALGARA